MSLQKLGQESQGYGRGRSFLAPKMGNYFSVLGQTGAAGLNIGTVCAQTLLGCEMVCFLFRGCALFWIFLGGYYQFPGFTFVQKPGFWRLITAGDSELQEDSMARCRLCQAITQACPLLGTFLWRRQCVHTGAGKRVEPGRCQSPLIPIQSYSTRG